MLELKKTKFYLKERESSNLKETEFKLITQRLLKAVILLRGDLNIEAPIKVCHFG
jgi:hypothetical protein